MDHPDNFNAAVNSNPFRRSSGRPMSVRRGQLPIVGSSTRVVDKPDSHFPNRTRRFSILLKLKMA
jgi:hypothetical protein